MKFYKMQGTGNSFVIVDEEQFPVALYEQLNVDRKQLAVKLCDFFKTDGVLHVMPSAEAESMMRIFNADGSEALMCGNGLRCFGRYVMDKRAVDTLSVETLQATYTVKRDTNFSEYLQGVEILLNNVVAYGKTAKTERLEAKFKDQYDYDYEFFTVSNPHVVTLIDGHIPDDETLKAIGGFANGAESPFEDGVNVNFATKLSQSSIYVRTFERGVGITKSCGTGMTSSVTRFAEQTECFNRWIDIYNDGGMIRCLVAPFGEGHYQVKFIGNATYEWSIEWPVEMFFTGDLSQAECIQELEESEGYAKFLAWTKEQINL